MVVVWLLSIQHWPSLVISLYYLIVFKIRFFIKGYLVLIGLIIEKL